MLIGILQCGHFPTAEGFSKRSYSDLYAGLLAGHGFTFRTWSVVDMDFPSDIRDADGWLVSGSKHGAYEDLEFIAPLEDFIRRAYAGGVPLVGGCIGHQIIAQALGGKVVKWPNGWSVGHVEYDFEGSVHALNAWHQDQVVERPKEARLVASSAFCENAAFVYEGPAFTVQPHPEFDAEAVDLLLTARAGVLPADVRERASALADKPVDNEWMSNRIAAFFKEHSHG